MEKGKNNTNAIEEACFARNRRLLKHFFRKILHSQSITHCIWPVFAQNDDMSLAEFLRFEFAKLDVVCKSRCCFCDSVHHPHALQIAAEHGAHALFGWLYRYYPPGQGVKIFPHDEWTLSFLLGHGHPLDDMLNSALRSHRAEAPIALLGKELYKKRDNACTNKMASAADRPLIESTIKALLYEADRHSLFSRIAFSTLKPQTRATKFMRALSLGRTIRTPPCSIFSVLVQTTFRFLIHSFPESIQNLIMDYTGLVPRRVVSGPEDDWME
jgi:hypothetical protein